MYDHLQPRLAKYLAAIYTGTDVPEIEQDIDGRLYAFAVARRHLTKLLRWNKQRGQTINQLNQRIHEQRLKICELNERVEDLHWGKMRYKALAEHWAREHWRVTKWNNAHKREIAQLQSKLHDRRVEVKLLLNENDVFSRAIQRRNKKIRELQDEIVAERRKVDALNKCADTYDEINEDLIRAVMQQDVELADWYEYVQLLIAKLNKRDEKIEALEKQYKHKCMSNDALASMLYDRDCEFK